MGIFIKEAFFSLVIAFVATALLGPLLIPILARLKAGQVIRKDGPQRHLSKAGTPTMGGVMIIAGVMAASLLLAGYNREVVLSLAALVGFGAIGFADDYIKVVLKRSLGLRAREKIVAQIFLALVFGIYLVFGLSRGTELVLPYTGQIIQMGYWYFPVIILVFLATSNAVNLTDGLDGLAAGCTVLVALGLTLVCFMTSHLALAVFATALAGACLGFLLYNRHPARVFMGDTGSMALGAGIAALAAITRSEVALIIMGGIFVIEAMSVILQVISFQTTGRRIFLMAPLHHHFELKGWHEKKVVRNFWGITAVLVLIGLISF